MGLSLSAYGCFFGVGPTGLKLLLTATASLMLMSLYAVQEVLTTADINRREVMINCLPASGWSPIPTFIRGVFLRVVNIHDSHL